ncbi:hypothetical protein VKT23_009375 [Stygiomarasmius scandens]|uniref:DUF6534 domain-containing protein n=1 Tax=Marasmiellus scandens TaxID=2682957 RepID=A0ABR1JGB9_9AGAR
MPATLQSPGEQQPLDNTMGVMLLGIIVSAILYGISLVQTMYYFNRYPKDVWYLKALVTITLVLDTVHMAFTTHTIYHYLVTEYYNKEALNFMIWSVLAEAVPTGVTGCLVQLFYTVRVWRLSNKNWFLAIFILVMVLGDAACGTAWVIISLLRETFQDLLGISGLTMTINVLSAAADVVIAVALCFLLQKSRTGFTRTDTIINKLILFVVNTGLATSLCAVASLISLLASPDTLIYAAFYFCIGRLYSNSLLAALNARNHIRGGGGAFDDSEMVSIPASVSPHPGQSLNALQMSRSVPLPHIKKNSNDRNISIRVDTTQEYRSDLDMSSDADEGDMVKLKELKSPA